VAHIVDDDSPRAVTMNERERDRLLRILHEMSLDQAAQDRREFAMTQAALALSATWEQVADAFGVSQDEARDRYAALCRRFGPEPAYPLNLPPGGPVPLDGPATPAIFVPLRNVAGATPKRIRELQDMLDLAVSMSGNLVDGKFAVLPAGAKILPAHPGREWVNVGLMAEPGNTRVFVATEEWGDVVPGLQCRLRATIGEQSLSFRLTPADGPP
jgi:hypothetical protein